MKRALVLAVEDEQQFADLLNRWLKAEEIDMILATSAGEAEDQLRSRRNDCDAVILDLGLDDSRGIDTFQRIAIAMGGDTRRTPIVIVTGAVDIETQRRLFHAGAADVVLKAMGQERIVRAIQQAIRTKPRKDSPPGEQHSIEAIMAAAAKTAVEPMAKDLRSLNKRVKRIEKSIYPDAPEDDDDDAADDSPKRLRRRPDWAGTIKQVAIAIMTVATTVGTLKMTQSQQPPPVAQQEQHAEQPRWQRRRDQDFQGQRGAASTTAEPSASAAP